MNLSIASVSSDIGMNEIIRRTDPCARRSFANVSVSCLLSLLGALRTISIRIRLVHHVCLSLAPNSKLWAHVARFLVSLLVLIFFSAALDAALDAAPKPAKLLTVERIYGAPSL